MTPIEIVLLVMGSSGFGGLAIGLYNAWVSARKGTVEEWRALLTEQRNLIDELRRTIADRDEKIAERDHLIEQLNKMIENLKDWAERLVHQLAVHAPGVKPEELRS